MGQQPASDQSPDDANSNVGYQTKSCPFHDLTSEPSRNETYEQNDE